MSGAVKRQDVFSQFMEDSQLFAPDEEIARQIHASAGSGQDAGGQQQLPQKVLRIVAAPLTADQDQIVEIMNTMFSQQQAIMELAKAAIEAANAATAAANSRVGGPVAVPAALPPTVKVEKESPKLQGPVIKCIESMSMKLEKELFEIHTCTSPQRGVRRRS